MARPLDDLIRQARKRALGFGGALAVLLALRAGVAVAFDADRLRFTIGGKLVPITELRKLLDLLELKIAKIMDQFAQKLQSGEWTVQEWHRQMVALINQSHVMFGALALGSVAVAATNQIVINRFRRDVMYLGGFARDISIGKVKSKPKLLARAKSYVRSMRITYQAIDHQLHIAAGFTEAKRVLRARESCFECVFYATRWFAIRSMPMIGTLFCKQYCRCYVIYRK